MIAEELEKLTGLPVTMPRDLSRGDYAVFARSPSSAKASAGKQAAELAEKINQAKPEWLEKAEAVGDFLNFHLTPKFFAENLAEILERKNEYGKSQKLASQKIMVEYTDPNPFKEFHIGHLMSNAIGEAISRLVESQGAEVKRANWQGDVGLHVAKAIWGLQKLSPSELTAKVLGQAYALGATQGDEAEIKVINKKLYDRSDEVINKLYDEGRKVSLEYFEPIYQKLGTKFDYYFFESQEGVAGKAIVEENLGRVFEKSEGAVIFRGEPYGLHTRVFINSQGLPTYETKELGLNKKKFEVEPELSQSIIVTGNEIKDYFKVLLKVIALIFPSIAEKTVHLSHGMLRLPTGKMSSRTGDVVTAEGLLEEVKNKLPEQTEEIRETIALAAIKYSILRQSPGKDIIFDFAKSLSFEGDSGPYLQYTCVRARSVLAKATSPEKSFLGSSAPSPVEKLLVHFPEVVARAAAEYAPQYLLTYLTELAAAFNSYYAQNKIIGSPEEAYRLVLTAAVAQVLQSGLTLLGIKVPKQM